MRSQAALERFRGQIVPLAQRTAEAGARYPLVAARYGERMHEWIVTWCDELEAELAPSPGPRKRAYARPVEPA
jgi:hypothetical protein